MKLAMGGTPFIRGIKWGAVFALATSALAFVAAGLTKATAATPKP